MESMLTKTAELLIFYRCATASMQMTYWLDDRQFNWKTHGGMYDTLHNLHTSQFHMHPVFLLSFFLSSPFITPPHTLRTLHPHTHYPSKTSPCAHTHTLTNTKMDQFHIPFQDAEDAIVSHCQFTAQCLIPPNAAMQISHCHCSFFLRAIFFLYALIRSKQLSRHHRCCILWPIFKNRAELLARHRQSNKKS